MARPKMKYHPHLILYKVFRRYLTKTEKVVFDQKMDRYKDPRSKQYYNGLLRYFDIEKLRKKPKIWEDIWIYNYCTYEVTDKVKSQGLIRKYEKEVFIADDKEFKRFLRKRRAEEYTTPQI